MSPSSSAKEEMGAYYTKEDVTAYISRSTILPFVLESVAARILDFIDALSGLLRADPDRYIPESVLYESSLPTETALEHAHRHNRACATRERSRSGGIQSVDDLVTGNLDIARLALDAIATASPDALAAFLEVLQSLTILDPTCGPGAFLFAAVDVLLPVWMALLDAMDRHMRFQAFLESVAGFPTRRYFVLRTIVANNLFGIDLMEEAVATCRDLFRRVLVEAAEGVEHEHGSSIPFHVRAGNALVGYAALPGDCAPSREELDHRLAADHGVDSMDLAAFTNWRTRHCPFHIPLEFPQIRARGGFDIILGNPPYLPRARVEQTYRTIDYETCGAYDLYALVLERTATLLCNGGRTGMIVPLSLTFGRDLDACRRLLFRTYEKSWFASFGRIPSALFSFDVRIRNTIHLGRKGKPRGDTVYTTRLHRWFGAYRLHLFPTLEYIAVHPAHWSFRIPKANSPALAAAFESRLQSREPRLGASLAPHETPHPLHFKRSAYNWLTSCAEPPPCFDAEGRPAPQTKFSTVHFHDAESRDLALLLLNGRIALAWWFLVGDDFDFTRWMIAEFPCDLAAISGDDRVRLLALSAELQTAMRANVSFKRNAGKQVGNYNLTRCRPITDRGDAIFLRLLGFEAIRADIDLLQSQVIRTESTPPPLAPAPPPRPPEGNAPPASR